jgi:hypothetical protein
MDLFHFPTRRRIIRVYILMMMMLFSVFPFLGVFSYWERERERPPVQQMMMQPPTLAHSYPSFPSSQQHESQSIKM